MAACLVDQKAETKADHWVEKKVGTMAGLRGGSWVVKMVVLRVALKAGKRAVKKVVRMAEKKDVQSVMLEALTKVLKTAAQKVDR